MLDYTCLILDDKFVEFDSAFDDNLHSRLHSRHYHRLPIVRPDFRLENLILNFFEIIFENFDGKKTHQPHCQ